MKSFAIATLLTPLICQSSAFISGNGVPTRVLVQSLGNDSRQNEIVTKLQMSSDSEQVSRRQVMKQTASLLAFTTASVFNSSPAEAKKDTEPVTRERIAASFQAVRDELGETGGVKTLGELVKNEDFDGVMAFTQNYDLEFRKAKMGKARKFVTSKKEKDRAVLNCNAVTFDLIGMNKSSRPGQHDIKQVQKYYSELETDISRFLDMEKDIDYSVYDL